MRPVGHVSLARALSKLAIASRAEATRLILDRRVQVNGRVVTDPDRPVVPERIRVSIDGTPVTAARWLLIALNKPRGVVTTRRDPEGRPTVFELLSDLPDARRLVPVGRLDLATSGLLLLTTDTQLAAWLTEPAHEVPRRYAVTVRGVVDDEAASRLTRGVDSEGERLSASMVTVRKRSGRETHLLVELREGRNREVRRLFDAIGYEVSSLIRVAFGPILLGKLMQGKWRVLSVQEVRAAFPSAPLRGVPEVAQGGQ